MAAEESVSPGGGYSDSSIYTYARAIFCIQILNFNILGFFFLKDEYFGSWGGVGYDETVNIFSGPSQNWTIFRGNL